MLARLPHIRGSAHRGAIDRASWASRSTSYRVPAGAGGPDQARLPSPPRNGGAVLGDVRSHHLAQPGDEQGEAVGVTRRGEPGNHGPFMPWNAARVQEVLPVRSWYSDCGGQAGHAAVVPRSRRSIASTLAAEAPPVP